MQVYPTVDSNSTVRGCGISVNQFLRGPPPIPIDYFLANLRKFLELVNIEKEVRDEFQSLINNFAFSLTIFTKYEEIFNRLSITSQYLLILINCILTGLKLQKLLIK